MEVNTIFDWPGKSAADGQVRHPAILHMLDVGAVAERLIEPFGIEPALRDALVLLVALHDLGKISETFRAMIEQGAAQRYRHWQLSEALFFAHDPLLGAQLGGNDIQRMALYAAVAGHHGQPSDLVLGELGGSSRDLRSAIRQVGSGWKPRARSLRLSAHSGPGLHCRALPPAPPRPR